MSGLDLTGLSTLLAVDRERNRGTGPTWAAMSEPSIRELHRTIRWLERSRPETYGLFGSEDELRVAVVNAFEPAGPSPRDLDALATTLAADADQEWVAVAPLANVMPPTEAEVLAPDTVFIATPDGERPDLTTTRLALRTLLQTDADPGRRRSHDANQHMIDTRHTASLVVGERGTRHACENRALCRAQYALAVWTLLEPPYDDNFMPLWPIATSWLPQPSIHIEVASCARDSDTRQPRGATVVYAPDERALYRPPAGDLRTAPFRALAAIDRHPATALLSAAWSLYLAARLPTDLQWLDRLELMVRARHALCEPPPETSGAGEPFERWHAVARRLEVDRDLRRRGFDTTDIASVTSRAWQLRGLATHSAEAALLALGYPPTRARPIRDATPIPGAELAPLHIRETVEPTFAAITFVARELWAKMLAEDFDEPAWELLLRP